ncbi:MAG: pantoate--beta-alanine ligase [Acidaminobacteraceae bacterium]
MKIIRTIEETKAILREERYSGKTIGFVATMGSLHAGHMSLASKSVSENDITVASIFVNPTQFDRKEDLDSYPRNFEADVEMLTKEGVDYVFAPFASDMYKSDYSTTVEVTGAITEKLCGETRPGHFSGVASVVSKLFNIVAPTRAYFGQKDAQQVAVIQRMVRDLNMDVEIVPCPIIREEDGLALSSRNALLTESERVDALVLSRSLFEAKDMIENGEKDVDLIKNKIIDNISTVKYAIIDYVEIVDAFTLGNVDTIDGEILIALAVFMGKPRLIDNIRLVTK